MTAAGPCFVSADGRGMTMDNVDPKLTTEFAPPERADAKSILRDADALRSFGLLGHVTHVIPSILVILNRQRQLVYSNQRLLELLKVSVEDILGKRPGEILDCVHATENAAGCGTTEFCRECGAVRAILKSQREKVGVVEECRITTRTGASFEFRVWASPYYLGGTDYTVFTLLEISSEKRRELLERTFFHDVNNILQMLIGYSEYLESAEDEDEIRFSVDTIRMAAEELKAEITSHRKLIEAEKGELFVELESGVNSLGLVEGLAKMAGNTWPDRTGLRTDACQSFGLTTDRTLLFRVLYNMIKNAFEASSGTDEVSIKCYQDGSSCVFSVHNPAYMPRATQLQIFQRSFSTKGRGRGIGSYSMKLFGEKYLKGKVWFTTSKEEGTTFSIALPLSYERHNVAQQVH